MTNCAVRTSALLPALIVKLAALFSPIQVIPPVTLSKLSPDMVIVPGPLAPTMKLEPPVLLKVPPVML